MKNSVMEEVRRIFKPEFLNRIDETIVFRALNKDDMKHIVTLLVKELKKRCKEQLDIELTVRDSIKNDHASYVKSASYDDSYECFKKYLRIVFAYSGSASMVSESTPIKLNEIRAGDVFLKGGSPGHVVMIVDVCTNKEGKKAFLLAQGYMPAQEFHLLKNPSHDDPWYYEDEVKYPFETPDYTFEEGSLRRLCY